MRTIATAAIVATAIIGATATTDAAPKQRPVRPVPFSATAAFGETVEILRHGPLTLLLQCRTAARAMSRRSPWSVARTTC